MVDRVDDRGCLVDVAEAAEADRPDDQELRVSAEAGDPLVVRDGSRGESSDESPVSVLVGDTRPVVDDVPGLGRLGREVRVRDVGAGVDDADLIALAALSTSGGTSFSRVATYCHS